MSPEPPWTVVTTLITLDVRHPVARSLLVDAHEAHRLTMSGFAHCLQKYDFFTGIDSGHADHRRALNILYAMTTRPNGTVLIRLQSDVAPDFSQPACSYWSDARYTGSAPVTRAWQIPTSGTIFYEMRANPVTSVQGHRRAITSSEGQLRWWEKKAGIAGLELQSPPDIDRRAMLRFPGGKNGMMDKPQRVLATWRFRGTATIVDEEAYRTAVKRGIGRGLSYGAGLLLTAPFRGTL
jgi:hypothetical protein